MNGTQWVLYLAGGIGALTLAPTVWVLGREALNRLTARRALQRMRDAREALRANDRPDTAARALAQRFDLDTIDRALEATLRAEPARRAWVAETYASLGITDRLVRDLREARSWSERARAAEVLGLIGSAAAGPALVAALRDPHEDTLSVKSAAAEALAAIRDPAVVPLLVRELHVIDEWSSPRVAEALVRFGPVAVPALVELLRDPEHSGAAVWAARALGRIGDASATAALIERLRDRQDAMRTAAAEALGAIRDRRAQQPLIESTLRDPMPQVRAHSAAALGRLGEEDASDVLVAALADPDFGTRVRALEALELLRPKNIAPLEAALRDPTPEIRRRSALALERVGYLEARLEEIATGGPTLVARAYAAVLELGRAGLVDSIAGQVHHASPQVREHIVRACADLGVGRVGPLLVAAAEDPAAPVRVGVAEALGRLQPPDGVAALLRLLGDAEGAVRDAAAAALNRYAPTETLPVHEALQTAFEQGSIETRRQLVEVLARHERADTPATLLAAAREPDEGVRRRAVEALARWPGPAVFAALTEALGDPEPAVRSAAVDGLGRREEPEAVETLLRALSGATSELRERIALALARGLPGQAALVERLARLAGGGDPDVRLGIAWTLGKLGDPAGAKVLTQFLASPDAGLRASAAGALGKLPAGVALAPLVNALGDRDARVRAALVNALGRTGEGRDEVAAALRARLVDPDGFVRNRAVLAIGRIGGEAAAAVLHDLPPEGRVDVAHRAIALAIVGTEATLVEAVRALADAGVMRAVRAQLESEDEVLRNRYLARLRLDHATGSTAALDEEALGARYHDLLRSSQDVASRALAVEALASLRGARSLETLGDALATDPAAEVRQLAARALALAWEHETARRALARAVVDPLPGVAVVAARALGTARDVASADVLFGRLASGIPELDDELVATLAKIFRDDPTPFVDRMMGAARTEVFVASLRVLEAIGHRSLHPLLAELLKGRDVAVRAGAVRALAALPLREAEAAIDLARHDAQEEVRLAALQSIARNGVSRSVERMLEMRADPSPAVRARLVSLLARAASAPAVAAVDAALDDAVATVRGAALGAILLAPTAGALRRVSAAIARSTPETVAALRASTDAPAIVTALTERAAMDLSEEQRQAAVLGLGLLALDGCEAALMSSLNDPSAAVRLAAVRTLSQLDRPEVVAAIRGLVDDPDFAVRLAAVTATRRPG